TVTFTVRDWPLPDGTALKLTLTGSSAIVASTAFWTSKRPAPTTLTSAIATPSRSCTTLRFAVFTIAERISAADQSGCCARTTAAVPARCGVAIDVPLKNAKHGGVAQAFAGTDDSTLTPGATRSGLTRKSTSVGPALVKSAIRSSPDASYTYVGMSGNVVDWPSEAISA